MKRITLLLLLFANAVYAQQGKIKHVIIIGVDGMSPDGVMKAQSPNMDSLMAHGSHSFECKAQLPTVSSPNWASIIMGVPPVAHGIWSNKWQVKDIKDSVYCNGKKGHIFPTIFRVLCRLVEFCALSRATCLHSKRAHIVDRPGLLAGGNFG